MCPKNCLKILQEFAENVLEGKERKKSPFLKKIWKGKLRNPISEPISQTNLEGRERKPIFKEMFRGIKRKPLLKKKIETNLLNKYSGKYNLKSGTAAPNNDLGWPSSQ